MTARPRVAVAPAGADGWIGDAVRAGGAEVTSIERATALVWTRHDDPEGLRRILDGHPDIEWVQLPWAGVEPYRDVLDRDRRWTCGKGVYAEPVAEMAVTLLIGGLRSIPAYTRATSWTAPQGHTTYGARIVILGGGGIAEAALRLLAPYRMRTTVVRRQPDPVPGADEVVGPDGLHDALRGADGLILALPLVPATVGIIGADELALLADHAWVVNVARGAHIDTDALVAALAEGTIGGAALDVTDPEPLPDDHPLWAEPRCVITPHVGNTPEMARPLLSARITENVRRHAAGEELIGPIDVDLGY